MLHADPAATAKIETHRVSWLPGAVPGSQALPLDAFADGRGTMLLRLPPGAAWTPEPGEVLVLEGSLVEQGRPFGPGGYFVVPREGAMRLHAPEGARLYVKRAPRSLSLAIDTTHTHWVPGLTPGLSHKPLYHQRGAAEAAAIVRWAPGTRVRGHDHPGGEEVLVLEGVFSDEHGDYPAGTWYRSPDMSLHTPFTRDGCVILARTGGLPQPPPAAPPMGEQETTATERRYVFDRPFPCDFEALAGAITRLGLTGWRGLSVTVEELYLAFDLDAGPLGPEDQERLERLVTISVALPKQV